MCKKIISRSDLTNLLTSVQHLHDVFFKASDNSILIKQTKLIKGLPRQGCPGR